MREWVAESRFDSRRTIYPVFVRPGTGPREKIPELPRLFRYSVEDGARHAGEAHEAGVPAVFLFGQSQRKDPRGKEANLTECPKIPVAENPARSRAPRICPTWWSIMALGATKSTPARA